ncbi:MAG: hypothetical protein DWQ34_03140 [Planctomycetota bacterium]|nr:MAG: hypothetical protein DWQ34_03140 [Planctomycetota bacterium]REK28338.1 MAG: hypothetical protein DWQ41_06070 [Planctomycetota bacterium]REK38814.1 MAG: hypothetical protein DWQ45_02915 [Planctomycetota bacterium]
MARSARLQSAVSWLQQFKGKNVVRGYCRQFGVDWRCAAIELSQLGVALDPDYLNQREQSEPQVINTRRQRRLACAGENSPHDPVEYVSMLDAYLAEDFAALYAMECKRDGIDPGSG